MMVRLAVLALLVSVANAETRQDPAIVLSQVTGELRDTTVVFKARYTIQLFGQTYQPAAASLAIPDRAVATSAVVHASDGAHRLDLVDKETGKEAFGALARDGSGKRWAVLVAKHFGSLDISIAGPRAATVTLEIEFQMPSCFYRDARYAEVPVQWRKALVPTLRTRSGAVVELGVACTRESETEQLWVAFPTTELATGERVGTNAARIDLGEAHIARLEVATSRSFGETPRDLATAILIDASRSMTVGQLEAQRELVKAYARAAPDSRLQVIAYARTPRALLPAWTAARTMLPRLERELRAITPRNGSNIDAALVEAARWLANVQGTKRVIVVTDQLLPKRAIGLIDTYAKLLPPQTLVHVVAVDESSGLERDWDSVGNPFAYSTGGMGVRSGLPDGAALDVTMLLKPVRLEGVEITAPGWEKLSVRVLQSSCDVTIEAGHSCVWWGQGERVAGPLVVDGWIWGKNIKRIVTPDPTRKVELARELSTADILVGDARERAMRLARGVTDLHSFYGEWGPRGGYSFGGFGTSGGGSSFTSAHHLVPIVRIGRPAAALPALDFAPQLGGVIAKCKLGEAHVEATIETTLSEIVGVTVVAPPEVAACVEEAIWDVALVVPRTHPRATTKVELVR